MPWLKLQALKVEWFAFGKTNKQRTIRVNTRDRLMARAKGLKEKSFHKRGPHTWPHAERKSKASRWTTPVVQMHNVKKKTEINEKRGSSEAWAGLERLSP